MQRQILVPLDGSKLAEQALPHAATMARATSSSLVLLQVVPPLLHTRSALLQIPKEDFAWAQTYLSRVEEGLRVKGVEVEIRVREGDAAKVIVSEVRQDPGIFLIAMSTHGRSGLGRWFFGSVAEKVLQTSPVPLLLIHPDQDQQLTQPPYPQAYGTVMVALDGNTPAEQALEHSLVLSLATGADLVLVSAVPALEGMAVYLGAASLQLYADTWQVENERIAGYLAETANTLRAAGFNVETQMVQGNPAEAIVAEADRLGPDIIIMPTQRGSQSLRGLHGLQDLLLGTVALKVVQEARLPVLLVPLKEAASPGQRPNKRAAGNPAESQSAQSPPETVVKRRGKVIGSRTY
jgi:nucleotide-binding universal stress UspA family protein